jgi:hypothetical protein
VDFERKNPVTSLMSDETTGSIREDILGEKVLSAIVEIKVASGRMDEIIDIVHAVEKDLATVIAIGVGARCSDDGEEDTIAPMLERSGYRLDRAKTNAGYGRITNQLRGQA